jgi:hypothetical protein
MTGVALAPDRWRQIEELFQAAVDMPAEERDTFLRGVCGSNEQLRLEVESLLANDCQESPLIARIVHDVTHCLLEDDRAARGED